MRERWAPDRAIVAQLDGGGARVIAEQITVRLLHQQLEAMQVEAAAVEAHDVAGRARDDRGALLAERLAKLRDAHLERGGARRRRLIAPQQID